MNAEISIFIFRMQSSLIGLQESLQIRGYRSDDQCQDSLKCGHCLNIHRPVMITLK